MHKPLNNSNKDMLFALGFLLAGLTIMVVGYVMQINNNGSDFLILRMYLASNISGMWGAWVLGSTIADWLEQRFLRNF